MTTCETCGGKGFLKAAPLSMAPFRPGGNRFRRALWQHAVMVPCWECKQAHTR